MKTKSLFYVTDINLSEMFAPTVHVVEIINSLSSLNCKTTLFCPSFKNDKNNSISADLKQIKFIDIGFLRSLTFQLNLIILFIFSIIRKKPDIVYLRQSSFLIFPQFICKLLSVKYVVEINGLINEELIKEKTNKLVICLSKNIEKFSYYNANLILCPSEAVRNVLDKRYNLKNKIVSVENGVNINTFKPISLKNSLKKTGLKFNGKQIGYIGGLQHWQGIDYMIKSMNILKKKRFKVRLLIIGEGPEKNNLIKIVKRYNLSREVLFLDSINHSDVPYYINSLDICLCYLNNFKRGKYGSPFKVYEYMSCGKPTIISDMPEIMKIFKENVLVAKAENEVDLSEKIIDILTNNSLRNKLSIKSRNFIVNGHSWLDVAKKTLNLIIKYYG